MRRLTMLGVGAATALLAAACGSDGDELSQEEFLAQANEICRVGNEEIAQLEEEFFPATGGEPTEEEFQEFIEAWRARRAVRGVVAICLKRY